eukprot:gene9829-2151_t
MSESEPILEIEIVGEVYIGTYYNLLGTSRNHTWDLQKRYREFHELYLYICSKHKNETQRLPEFPPKILQKNEKMLITRKSSLNEYIQKVVSNSTLMTNQF